MPQGPRSLDPRGPRPLAPLPGAQGFVSRGCVCVHPVLRSVQCACKCERVHARTNMGAYVSVCALCMWVCLYPHALIGALGQTCSCECDPSALVCLCEAVYFSFFTCACASPLLCTDEDPSWRKLCVCLLGRVVCAAPAARQAAPSAAEVPIQQAGPRARPPPTSGDHVALGLHRLQCLHDAHVTM